MTTPPKARNVITRGHEGGRCPCHSRKHLFRATALLLWIILAAIAPTLGFSDEEPQDHLRVLILYSFEKEIATFAEFDQALRDKLNSSNVGRIVFYTEYLDLARFPNAHHEKALVASLAEKYSNADIDLVIPVNLPAIEFTRKHQEEIFGATPMVFSDLDCLPIKPFPQSSNVTGLAEIRKIDRTLGAALQLLPDTRQVVLVSGSLPYERDWDREVRKELRGFESRVAITSLTNFPMDEVLKKLAALPEHTIVLYTMMWRDSAGEDFLPEESLALFSRASNAPIFGEFDEYLGMGIVGGDLENFRRAGTMTGELGLRVLGGAKLADIPVQYDDNANYKFDWRQLQRWQISENYLPPGSIVLFREPSPWERYKRQIIGLVSLVILQAVLIGLLLAQRSRRMRAESMLRASEKASRQQLRRSPVALLMAQGADQEIVFINDKFMALFGYTLEDIPNIARWWALAYPDEAHREAIKAQWQARVKQGDASNAEAVPMEAPVQCKDGSRQYIEFHFSSLGDAQLVSFVDLTERKRAEEALRELQDLTNTIVDSTSDMIWSVDSEHFGLLTFNRSLNDYFRQRRGISLHTGMSPEDLFPSDDKAIINKWREFYQRALAEGPYSVDYDVYAGSNVLQLTFNLLKREGKVFGVSVFGKDITERQRAQDELRESEARFRLLFARNPIPMWVRDQETLRFMEVNDAAVAHYGYSRDEFLRMSITDIRPPEDIPQLHKALAEGPQTLDAAGPWRHRLKDGRIIRVQITRHPLLWNGRHSILVAAQDVTERLRAEEGERKAQDQYRNIFNEAVAGIYRSSPQGRLLAANPAMARMLGYDSADDAVASITDTERQVWADPGERLRLIQLHQQQEIVRGFECQFLRRMGQKSGCRSTAGEFAGRTANRSIMRAYLTISRSAGRPAKRCVRARSVTGIWWSLPMTGFGKWTRKRVTPTLAPSVARF